MTSKCRAVANYIIEEMDKFNEGKDLKEQVFLSTKRLQKLLYFCEVEYMRRNNGKPLFEDEFYAWPSGPIIEGVYPEFMIYQNGKIHPRHETNEQTLSKDIKLIIEQLLESTKDLDTIDLVNMSSVVDGPWAKVFDLNDPNHKQIISKKDIYNYYLNKSLIDKYTELTGNTKVLKLTKK